MIPIVLETSWGPVTVAPKTNEQILADASSVKGQIASAVLDGKTYQTSSGATIYLADTAVKSPALAKAIETGGLTVVPTTADNPAAAGDLMATGLSIKPLYLAIGAVALVILYFVWKKYGKK